MTSVVLFFFYHRATTLTAEKQIQKEENSKNDVERLSQNKTFKEPKKGQTWKEDEE